MTRPALATMALIAILVSACVVPWQPAATTGYLTVQFGPLQGRTVVPDLSGLLVNIEAITLTIERTDAAMTTVELAFTGIGVTETAKTVTDLVPGSYTIQAHAFDGASLPVAESAVTAFTVAAGITATVPLALAPSFTTGTGGIDLRITYPTSAGVTQVATKVTHRLTDAVVDNGNRTPVVEGTAQAVRLTLSDLPVGPYDLDLTLTDSSGTRTYRQAVNVFAGSVSDRVVGSAGLLTEWTLTNDYFGSSTFLASLTSAEQSFAFSSPTRDYTVATGAASLHYTATASYAGQVLEYWNGSAWTGVPSGSSFGPLALPHALTIRVTAPGGARGYYTVSAIEAIGVSVDLTTLAPPPLEFQTPTSGNDYWAMDEVVTITADAAGATGTWSWLFDGAIVAGQNTSTFSVAATALVAASETGAHAITALFTSKGVTWARQKTVYFTTANSDVTLFLRTQETNVGIGGSALVRQGELLDVFIADNDLSQIWWEVQGTGLSGNFLVTSDESTDALVSIPTSTLLPAWYTLFVRGLLADGTVAGVLVPFEIRTAGSIAGPFEVSLQPRFLPAVAAADLIGNFSPSWNQALAQPLSLGLRLPELGIGFDPDATAVQIIFQGTTTTIDANSAPPLPTGKNAAVVVSFNSGSHPAGIYALNILYWAGPLLADRRLMGSMTIMISAYAGGGS